MPRNENYNSNIQDFADPHHPRVEKEEVKVRKPKKSFLKLDCFEDPEEQR